MGRIVVQADTLCKCVSKRFQMLIQLWLYISHLNPPSSSPCDICCATCAEKSITPSLPRLLSRRRSHYHVSRRRKPSSVRASSSFDRAHGSLHMRAVRPIAHALRVRSRRRGAGRRSCLHVRSVRRLPECPFCPASSIRRVSSFNPVAKRQGSSAFLRSSRHEPGRARRCSPPWSWTMTSNISRGAGHLSCLVSSVPWRK
jgi:hypothetical protein